MSASTLGKPQTAAKRRRKASNADTASAIASHTPVPVATNASFSIAGIGASAGGIEPFLEILRGVGERPGLAILFVLHQEKKHPSHLVEVIARATKMPVVAAADGVVLECNRVYIAPPAAAISISKAKLKLIDQPAHSLTIDYALRALGENQGDRAIGVLLSGSGSDGALGMQAIKAEGGITFAQEDAAFPHMPQSAISLGVVDFVLPPAGIAKELLRIALHAAATGSGRRLPEQELHQVFRLLQTGHDVDFTHYKPSTVERRIRRRMAVHKVSELADYLAILRDKPAEVHQLYREILIHVTGFFRDPDAFLTLQRDVVPLMLKGRSNTNPVRIWVPGCATGEEVYSLAISVLEALGDVNMNCPVQIFGTDISEDAIDRARLGIYPENISAEVSPERLRSFFTKVDGGYRVAKAVRDCCVFARQNLTRDPPFSRLDLVSCRNVMIYLGVVLQRRVMSIFHYALRQDGYLLLGSSESVGNFGELFEVVDRKHKIYRKKPAASRITPAFEVVDFEAVMAQAPAERGHVEEETASPPNVFREADRVMLSRYSPPGVVINEEMDVLQFRGRTSLYLEPAPGVASFNILKMAREGLLAELRNAIHSARKKEGPVRREGVRVKTNGDMTLINLEVIPFVTAAKERFQLVLFEPVTEPVAAPVSRRRVKSAEAEEDSRATARLRRELEATREYLQSIIEEQEAMNEELRSANEEIQSSNEELQSTNEELETAKEELQSSNEELTTLNEELQNRNEELGSANNDLVNLLASVDLPIVMLDSSLRIRRFNPSAQRVLNLIAADAGRPIHDLKMTLVIKELEPMIVDVIENLEVRELEVRDRRGQSYLLRIRPYKTVDNKIEGAVLVLIDGVKGKKK